MTEIEYMRQEKEEEDSRALKMACMHQYENETHKLLWDCKMQTDHLISARRSDLVIINKKRKKKKRKKQRGKRKQKGTC